MTRLWHWIRRGLLAVVLLFVAYQLWLLGHVLWWKWNPPSATSFMSLRLDELAAPAVGDLLGFLRRVGRRGTRLRSRFRSRCPVA